MMAESVWSMVFRMPQLPIILAFTLPIVGIIAGTWYKVARVRSENELKRTLAERGMSVEQIERVIAARAKDTQD
jgi:hypothetical protein